MIIKLLKFLAANIWNWRYEAYFLYYLSKTLKGEEVARHFHDVAFLKSLPQKDTVFIFGSGYSINSIRKSEWEQMRKTGDTFSFNEFVNGRFIDIDFHIVREIYGYRSFFLASTHKAIEDYLNRIYANPRFKKTTLFVLHDKKSPAMSLAFLKKMYQRKIVFYSNLTNRYLCYPPSETNQNIPHGQGTLFDAVNLSYVMGYKNIVLVGVDLYDRRYFWLNENETRITDLNRNKRYDDIHATAKPLLDNMGSWEKYFQKKSTNIYVYNPKSLLNRILPIYSL